MTRFRQHPRVLERQTAEAVLLRTIDGRGAVLRGTSIALWEALGVPQARDQLVDLMRTRFQDPGAAIADDVDALLERLVTDGLVARVDDA